jgi:hypothetical protein
MRSHLSILDHGNHYDADGDMTSELVGKLFYLLVYVNESQMTCR